MEMLNRLIIHFRKLLSLLAFLCAQKESHSQAKPFYNAYASYNRTENFYVSHELGVNINKNIFSARYNYEALKHLVAYYGYSFSKETKNYEYEITPMIGFVTDFDNTGNSLGLQGYYYSPKNKLYLYSQAFHINYFQKGVTSFFYNWSEAGYDIKKMFIVGGSYILTAEAGTNYLSYGPFLYKEVNKRVSFSAYLLSFWDKNEYYLIGVSYNF